MLMLESMPYVSVCDSVLGQHENYVQADNDLLVLDTDGSTLFEEKSSSTSDIRTKTIEEIAIIKKHNLEQLSNEKIKMLI